MAGALDSLRAGRIEEGKARLLAAEASMEEVPPPFSSFARHSPPDMLEPQHTRLWPTAWAEAYMFKVRELDDFVEKRSKLGRRVNPFNRLEEEDHGKGGGKKGKKGKNEMRRGTRTERSRRAMQALRKVKLESIEAGPVRSKESTA